MRKFLNCFNQSSKIGSLKLDLIIDKMKYLSFFSRVNKNLKQKERVAKIATDRGELY